MPPHTKLTEFICMVSNHCSEVTALFCVYIWIDHTASSCTEISSFFYSALNSCLNSSAEASVSETVTLDAVVTFAHHTHTCVCVYLEQGASCLCLTRNTSSRVVVTDDCGEVV